MSHPVWFDPKAAPTVEDCVVPRLIDRHAAATPHKVFLRFETGEEWTWAQAREIALKTAAAFQARGVEPGDVDPRHVPHRAGRDRRLLAARLVGRRGDLAARLHAGDERGRGGVDDGAGGGQLPVDGGRGVVPGRCDERIE